MQNPINIIIAEDMPIWRQTVRACLEDYNIKTIAEAGDGIELQQHLKSLAPDVILLDLKMPNMDGNDAMKWLTQTHPEQKVIVISYNDDPALMEEYLLRGAKAYITKDSAMCIEGMADVINKVYNGGSHFDYDRDVEASFNLRQREILSLIADGNSIDEIASVFDISSSAVHKQVKTLKRILKVKTLAQLQSLCNIRGFRFFRRPPNNNRPGQN